jgi:hypothetical protein
MFQKLTGWSTYSKYCVAFHQVLDNYTLLEASESSLLLSRFGQSQGWVTSPDSSQIFEWFTCSSNL